MPDVAVVKRIDQLLDAVPGFRDKFGDVVQRDQSNFYLNSLRAPTPYRLNFQFLVGQNIDIATAIVGYICHQIQNNSAQHAHTTLRALRKFITSKAFKSGGDIVASVRAFRVAQRKVGLEYILHYVRDWYLWSSAQGYPAFDDWEKRWQIRDLKIPGNAKGVAVLTEDPDSGPLFEQDEIALRATLHRAENIPLRIKALLWICLTLGPNPLNVALLKEEDFKILSLRDQKYYSLSVPRIKKRVAYRSQFKVRKLDTFVGGIIEDLIEQNRRDYPFPISDRPLFFVDRERKRGGSADTFKWHLSAAEISGLVQEGSALLNAISPITKKTIRLTPRRLRYAFACRMVRQGCSQEELAELLDHSDLQNVIIYFSNRSNQLRLDNATAKALGPLVRRYTGKFVVDLSDDGTNGGRIKDTINLLDLGTCGSRTLCNLYPPLSCYVCPKFHAWKEGPHERVLTDVIRLAERHPRDAVQLNEVIVAIGEVVAACNT